MQQHPSAGLCVGSIVGCAVTFVATHLVQISQGVQIVAYLCATASAIVSIVVSLRKK